MRLRVANVFLVIGASIYTSQLWATVLVVDPPDIGRRIVLDMEEVNTCLHKKKSPCFSRAKSSLG